MIQRKKKGFTISRNRLAMAVALGVSIGVAGQVSAFKPTEFAGDATSGFDGRFDDDSASNPLTHVSITEAALLEDYTLESGNIVSWSTSSIGDIKKANKCVDALVSLPNCTPDASPAAHCDAEHIKECGRRVIALKAKAIFALQQKDFEKSRKHLGRALHTIQDFYSHTNYADIYHALQNETFTDLYPDNFLTQTVINQGDDGIPLGLFSGSTYSSLLEGNKKIDGLHPNDWTCEQVVNESGKMDAEKYLNRSWKRITSGYYDDESKGNGDAPFSKCQHGGFGGADGVGGTLGINHDVAPLSEESDSLKAKRFVTARDMAIKASRVFIQDFLDRARVGEETELRVSHHQKVAAREAIPTDDILKLMGQESTPEVNIGFLVDTTGSMGSTITGIKSAIARVVEDIDSGSKSISKFLVMVYGDPDFGNISIAENTEDMTSSIEAITLSVPNVGGDCPERTTEAVRLAINAAPDNTSLFVYTDADSKETELADAIIAQAQAKSVSVNFFVSGNCGGVSNDVYSIIAQGTGGSVSLYEHDISGAEGTFAQINPVFVGNLQESIRNQSKLPALAASRGYVSSASTISIDFPEKMQLYTGQNGNSSNIILPKTAAEKLQRRTLSKPISARGEAVPATETGMTAVEELISVSSSTTSLIVNIEMSPLQVVKLYKPDGSEILSTDENVSISDSSVGITFTISSPEAGNWKAYIEGTPESNYSLSVRMNSSVSLLDFEFTEYNGRGGHEGMYPISGQPLTTSPQTFSLTMDGSIETAMLVLRSLDGAELSTSSLSRSSQSGTATHLTGSINLPNESFRVYVEGKDKDGNNYSRVHSDTYLGQSVSVSSSTVSGSPLAGKTLVIDFDINNSGLTDTFDITTTNSEAYSNNLSNTNISITAGGSEKITVTVNIPVDAPSEKEFTVTLKAQSQTNPESNNTSTVSYTINADTDGDGVSDEDETLRSQGDFEFDGNADGTADWQQANVASVYTQSGSVMTLELSSGEFSSLEVIADPSSVMDKPDDASFPSGYFAYTISGLTEGAETALRVHYPLGYVPSKYYRYGPTTALAAPAWNEHAGTEFGEKFALLSLTDGADGDNDLLANSTINGTGGFGFIPNQKPSTTTDIYTTKVNTSVTTLNVLSNDSDPDGDSFTLSDASITSTSGGTVVNHGDGTFTYSPAEGYVGEDAFIYFVTDSKNAQAVGRVKITVEKGVVSGDTETGGGGSVGWLEFIFGIGLVGSLYIRRSVFSVLKREAKS